MKRFGLGVVSCSKQKISVAAPVRDYYCSPLFKKILRAAELSCKKVVVLSAKYGILFPDEVIQPYDLCIRTYGSDPTLTPLERTAWFDRVSRQLLEFSLPITYFCGQAYYLRLPPGEVLLNLPTGLKHQLLDKLIEEAEG